jgi:CBS domain containing-hemolysin-like protein
VQLAIVRDNNHKTLGVLTVEDILEELVGEIQDEEDTEGTVKHHA